MSLVSVCMITYNHEKYIAQAIEGVLMQECDFPVQLVIGEDHSTDHTRQICEGYAGKYPNQIILLPDPGKNLGPALNFTQTFNACNGDYIASCEGDDYWTEPQKLQKQVDFLEANKEYLFCGHGYLTVDENNEVRTNSSQELKEKFPEGIRITEDNVFDRKLTKTLTLLYHKDRLEIDLKSYSIVTDTVILFHLINKGHGYWLPFKGGVYRLHQFNNWANLKKEKQLLSGLKTYNYILSKNPDGKRILIPIIHSYYQFILRHLVHPNNRHPFQYSRILKYSFLFLRDTSEKLNTFRFLRREIIPVIWLKVKMRLRGL